MTWRQLWQYARAVWRSRRATFEYCRECGIPLTKLEAGIFCIDCHELKVIASNDNMAGIHQLIQQISGPEVLARYRDKQGTIDQLRGTWADQQGSINQLGLNQRLYEQQQQRAQQHGAQLGALGNLLGGLGNLGGLFGGGHRSNPNKPS